MQNSISKNRVSTLLIAAACCLISKASAQVIGGYSDNPCTAKFTSITMKYDYKGKVIWNPPAGPTVYYTAVLSCKDGQTFTETSTIDAYTWVPKTYYDREIYDRHFVFGSEPSVKLNSDGNLTFNNGYVLGSITSPLKVSSESFLQDFILRYWQSRDNRNTDPRNIQTWSSLSEAHIALLSLPRYDPAKEVVSYAYEKIYPAFPWINNNDDRTGNIGSTPRPVIRVNYTGPTGTLDMDGKPAKYSATVYCFPGRGDQDYFNRPIIVSDAYDAFNARSAWTIYSNPRFAKLLSLEENSPRNIGYDIFFVDFSQGGGNMLINASLYLKVIEWMHTRTQNPILVGGPSQGGIVSRLALLYSIPENNSLGIDLAPTVKGYLSMDSPHQGAYIGSSLQTITYDASVDKTINFWAIFKDGNSAIESWKELCVPSAHQMLYSHYYSNGAISQKSHDEFYAFLRQLGTGKTLGDARGYRKDIPKVAIAYSSFYKPLGALSPYTPIVGARLDVDPFYKTLFSRNMMAGGPQLAPDPQWLDIQPGSSGDFYWSEYAKKSKDFITPRVFNNETFMGTFMPIKSVLDLEDNFNTLAPPTQNEEELAEYSPFNAIYYMRDTYNDYVRFKDPTQSPDLNSNGKRYEHLIFDNQLMTAIMLGLKSLEDAPEHKIVTSSVVPATYKIFTLFGPNSVAPLMRTPFKFVGTSGSFISNTSTLPSNVVGPLTEGLARYYEGNFDRDQITDALMVQGHNWKASKLLLSSPNSDKKLTPYEFSRPEMTEGAKITVADFNGDGMDDILTLVGSSQASLLVDLSKGDGTFTSVRQSNPNFLSWAMQPEVKVITADFNNDGRADIALVGGYGWNDIRLAWSKGNGTFSFQNISGTTDIAWSAAKKGARIIAGTFQGTKEMGIAVASGNTISIASISNGTAYVTMSVLSSLSGPESLAFWSLMADPQASIITADFNGDGRTDIALTGGASWKNIPVAFSTGDGNFKITNNTLADFPGWAAGRHVQVSTADLNLDGKADILLTGGISWSSIPVAYSNGDGSFKVVNHGNAGFGFQASQPGIKAITRPISVPVSGIAQGNVVQKNASFNMAPLAQAPQYIKELTGTQIGPNPAINQLQVFFNTDVERGEAILKVVDLKGVLVLSKELSIEPGRTVNLNVAGFTVGQYYLVVEKNNRVLYSASFQKR